MKYINNILIIWLFYSSIATAQENTQTNSPPAGIRWLKIDTDHFRVLFPKNFSKQGQQIANTLEHIRGPESKSLGTMPRKITVLLHNQSAVSNGFVAQAPWRSEFFTMPSQNYNFLGANNWLSALASHEYRHIVQFHKSRTGISKIFYYLFGEFLQSGLAFITVPAWFWEGDAVATETAFTHGGRGRIPQFNMLMRTNLLEGRNFNYHKQYLRSYKHNIPNHYVLGYHMVAYLRKKTGNPNIWDDITQQAWSLPLPFAFSRAIKKEAGVYVQELYQETMDDLKKTWEQQQETITPTPFERLNKRKSDLYTDYAYPQPLEDGNILVLKSGIGDISTFITIDPNGKEHKRFVPGIMNISGMLSTAQNKVVWNEYHYDPRWRTRSYSVVKGYDLSSKKLKIISKQSRYAAAAISPDGMKIVTVETNAEQQTQMVILHYASGEIIKKIPNPGNPFISMPRWSNDGQYIVYLSLSPKSNKSIKRYDTKSGKTETILKAGTQNIGHPVQYGKYIFYNSPISGIDNIYALDLAEAQTFQVTSGKYGAYNPSITPTGQTIYYNNQSKNGLDVVKIPFDPATWTPLDSIPKTTPGIYSEILTKQERHPDLMDNIPSQKYPVKRYRRTKGMINPHSWGLYTNTSFSTINLGILSQDILSTSILNLGYAYNINEKAGFWNLSFNYQGLYPIFNANVKYGNRSATAAYIQNDSVKSIRFTWKETNVEAGIRLPLFITRSKYIRNVYIGNFFGFIRASNFRNSQDGNGRFLRTSPTQGILFRSYVDNGNLVYNRLNAGFTSLLKQSRRDINSRWGQSLRVNFLSTYPGNFYKGSQFSALLILYFPGLFPHHSLWGYGAWQYNQIENNLNNYLFRNQTPVPRGHQITISRNYYMGSVNYTLPILYPDLALGPIINFQRIWSTVFFDYAIGVQDENRSQQYTSIGGELRFDINLFRVLQKINLGIRYTHALETGSSKVQFILGRIGF